MKASGRRRILQLLDLWGWLEKHPEGVERSGRGGCDYGPSSGSHLTGPEASVAAAQHEERTARLLGPLVESLNAAPQQVLRLRYVEQLGPGEIAGKMGCDRRYVAVQHCRACKALEQGLKTLEA